jgi:hypothetical protein
VNTLPNSKELRAKIKKAVRDSTPIRVDDDGDGNVRIYSVSVGGDNQPVTKEVHRDPGFNEARGRRVAAFNPDYLTNIMASHDGPVTIRTVDPMKPAMFEHPNGFDLLMPVRIP